MLKHLTPFVLLLIACPSIQPFAFRADFSTRRCIAFSKCPENTVLVSSLPQRTAKQRVTLSKSKAFDNDDDNDNEDDDEEVEPGKMRVSEIKAELDLRNISYKDCFDKESLVQRLQDARASGKADPSILEKFNKQKLEQQFKEQKIDIRDEDIDAAVANDGTLPGGLSPDMFKKLTSNPEIMMLLQSTKMQEAMKLMMTGGREELEKKLQKDPELQETVEKLDSIMKSLQ
jgi:hypothetical protein